MNINKGDIVTIKKLKAVDNPKYPTPPVEGYIYGVDNGDVSLPVEYEIEGKLLTNIEVGSCVSVARERRNSTYAPGLFASSVVASINGNKFLTQNSVYEVVKI